MTYGTQRTDLYTLEMLEKIKIRDKKILLCHFRASQKVPRFGGPSQPLGGGGAPKFFLNWLTFARLPYDADQI